jgi:hypothetical protein
VALLVTLAPAAAACVTPKDDYEDFLARTADARAALSVVKPVDAGAFEAALPDGGFEGAYFMSCLASVALGDPTKALNFSTNLEVLPGADGGSTLSLAATALVFGATDLSQTVGGANMASGTLDGTGVGHVVFPMTLAIPGAANPISPGMDITIAPGTDLKFYVSTSSLLCAGLAANITAPERLTLAQNATPCVLRSFPQPSGPLPTLTADDYHCP